MSEKKTTARGFPYFEFTDYYGKKCSFQESSIAEPTCIWLGLDDPEPKIMASKARSHGVETSETCGWVPFPIPEDVSIHTRMHLTRKQAGILAKQLLRFSLTGKVTK